MNERQRQQIHAANPFQALRGLTPTTVTAAPVTTVAPLVARARRLRRPSELVSTMQRLDTSLDPAALASWLGWIAQTYERGDCGLLLGLFAHCYLGERDSDHQMYVDHRLDLTLRIMEHYAARDPVPCGFEPARPLARNESYAYIEVYTDGTVIPIYPDGRPG